MIPISSNSDEKTKCIIGNIICVACTFHLCWASQPTQCKENAYRAYQRKMAIRDYFVII